MPFDVIFNLDGIFTAVQTFLEAIFGELAGLFAGLAEMFSSIIVL